MTVSSRGDTRWQVQTAAVSRVFGGTRREGRRPPIPASYGIEAWGDARFLEPRLRLAFPTVIPANVLGRPGRPGANDGFASA